MKIAIFTLHRILNYGSVLQAYATQRIFQNYATDAVIIDYYPKQARLLHLLFEIPEKRRKNFLYTIVYLIMKWLALIIKIYIFSKFNRKNLNLSKRKYTDIGSFQKDSGDYDAFVAGSDQIWNSIYNKGVNEVFFLNFPGANKRRFSFASSFGREKLDEKEIKTISKYINAFDAVSVREYYGLDILKKMGRCDGLCILDPTLQMKKDEWEKIANKRIIEEKYLLIYILNHENEGVYEYAEMLAKDNKWKIIKIGNGLKEKRVDIQYRNISPETYLSLFMYAEYIITNSFHGVAFSTNFNRQFVSLKRNRFNSRVASLLKVLDLEKYMVDKLDTHNPENIDYKKVNVLLERERNKAHKYIYDNFFEKNN